MVDFLSRDKKGYMWPEGCGCVTFYESKLKISNESEIMQDFLSGLG